MHDKPSEAAALVLTIDLGALVSNWRRLAAMSAPAECAAVVKADAYGIGIAAAVPVLAAAGCRTFFVALPEEGRQVRAAAPAATIYVLDGFLPGSAETFRAAALRPVLNTIASLEAWARDGGGMESALMVDTGMNRLGLTSDEAAGVAARGDLLARAAPRLLMSHLACADQPDHRLNQAQLALFNGIRERFPGMPASLANSAGIHLGSNFHFDLVRPGIALYGAAFSAGRPPLANVVTARARILQVRKGKSGDAVGYGAARRLAEDAQIAVVAAGYADGYHRLAGSSDARAGASVLVNGRPAPLLGRVSMDLLAVDVTGIPDVAEGGWVELFGAELRVDAAAAAAETIGYEFLTGLSRRAARIYVDGR